MYVFMGLKLICPNKTFWLQMDRDGDAEATALLSLMGNNQIKLPF